MTCCRRPVSTSVPAAAGPCVARCYPPATPPIPLQLSYAQFVVAGWLQTVSDVLCRTCAMLVLD